MAKADPVVQLQRRRVRCALIALAAAVAPVVAGCLNDGVVIGSQAGRGKGGTGGAAGASAGAGGGVGGSGGAGASVDGGGGSVGGAAADGGVNPADGGSTLAWVDLSPCHFPATMPSGRNDPLITFDPDRGKLIAYGGYGNYSDLWEVDLSTGLRTDRTTCAYVDLIANSGDALVYDAARRRVVVFPYNGASNVREWDPVANVWTDRPPPSGAVPEGEGRVAVFDSNRARVIVFVTHIQQQSGGLSIWEWDGATGTWTLRESAFPMPFSFGMPSLAFDASRGLVWGFGGLPDAPSVPVDRLWTWNVATTELVDLTPAARPAAWPPARAGGGLAYDRARDRLDLYGGFTGSLSRRDLWELDPAAATWVNLTPSGISATGSDQPPGLVWPQVDYIGDDQLFADPAHGRLVYLHADDLMATGHSGAWLWDTARSTWSEPKVDTPPALWPANFGYATAAAWDDDDRALWIAQYGELWRWTAVDGVWTALAWRDGMGAPNSLPVTDGMAIAYDPKARKLVLFGGYVSTLDGSTPGALSDDLRLWDPVTARLSTTSRPAGAAWPDPRRYHALAYDPVRQRVLLFGGSKPEPSNDLWELDTATTTWRDLSGASGGAAWPATRMGHGLALDPDRQVLVLRGGGDTSTNPVAALDDTWELAAGTTSWTRRAEPAPNGPTGAPVAYVAGMGMMTLAWSNLTTADLDLVRWDATSGAWTPVGVALPPSAMARTGMMGGLVGARDHLMMLWAPVTDMTIPDEDLSFFRLWRWGATP